MREVDAIYLYEHVDRELDVACAVKSIAESRYGITVELVQHPLGSLMPGSDLDRVRPRVVALPHCYRSAVYTPYLLDWPEAVYVNLMWEQIFYKGNNMAKIPHGAFALNHVLHLVWGEFAADYLQEAGVPRGNIVVNGHPAYKLYDEPYRRYYIQRRELAQKHGFDLNKRWVFFPENYNWAFYSDVALQGFIQLGQKPEDVYAMRDFCRDSLDDTIRWCAALARTGQTEIIVRPRPATPLEEFKAAVHRIEPDIPIQMHIIKDESIREWILASDVVVSSYSTSLIEAAVAGKPAYILEPYPIPSALRMDWHKLTPRLRTQAEFEAACLGANGKGHDHRLADWSRATMMARGDPISNLADLLAKLSLGQIPHPPTVHRKDIPDPRNRPMPNWLVYQYHRALRKYQHVRVRMNNKQISPERAFEKDLVSRNEIDRRANRWTQLLAAIEPAVMNTSLP